MNSKDKILLYTWLSVLFLNVPILILKQSYPILFCVGYSFTSLFLQLLCLLAINGLLWLLLYYTHKDTQNRYILYLAFLNLLLYSPVYKRNDIQIDDEHHYNRQCCYKDSIVHYPEYPGQERNSYEMYPYKNSYRVEAGQSYGFQDITTFIDGMAKHISDSYWVKKISHRSQRHVFFSFYSVFINILLLFLIYQHIIAKKNK